MTTVECPAKVNLFLSVGPTDESGYHPIRTTFCAISTADTLTIKRSTGNQDIITCDWSGLPERNTVSRALSMSREYHSFPALHVHLEKRIPHESGLGGGSSDAAGLLRGLRQQFASALSKDDAHTIAAAVGADVPFFLTGGLAHGEGYGDRITPLPDVEPKSIVLARPDVGVSTAEAYRKLDAMPRRLMEFPESPWMLHNDFEAVAPCVCGELAERMQVHGCEAAQLTGSGSAVFGLCTCEDHAVDVARVLRSEFPSADVWIACTFGRTDSLRSWRTVST